MFPDDRFGNRWFLIFSSGEATPARFEWKYNTAHVLPADAVTPGDRTGVVAAEPAYQAYWILRVCFAIVPIAAGLDKFFHVLVNWNQYLAPVIPRKLPFAVDDFMLAVGAFEAIAGLTVALRPRVGAYVVMFWLWAIVFNLLLIPGDYDIALRDFGLSLGALALGQLSQVFDVPDRNT